MDSITLWTFFTQFVSFKQNVHALFLLRIYHIYNLRSFWKNSILFYSGAVHVVECVWKNFERKARKFWKKYFCKNDCEITHQRRYQFEVSFFFYLKIDFSLLSLFRVFKRNLGEAEAPLQPEGEDYDPHLHRNVPHPTT